MLAPIPSICNFSRAGAGLIPFWMAQAMTKRETTEFRQGHFEEWRQSGLTQVAYCERNIAFIRDHLKIEGLLVTSEDVGETFHPMVVYFPATGWVRVKRLRSLHNHTIATQEIIYNDTLKAKPVTGEVELF